MQSQNISDVIEAYLKKILGEESQIEIKRSEIAQLFECVPSQINYVINTRFTVQQGYLVESKRGGGGYIRIEKVKLVDSNALLSHLIDLIDEQLLFRDGFAIVEKLFEEEVINKKEANIILAAIDRNALNVENRALENHLRARILVTILNSLRYEN